MQVPLQSNSRACIGQQARFTPCCGPQEAREAPRSEGTGSRRALAPAINVRGHRRGTRRRTFEITRTNFGREAKTAGHFVKVIRTTTSEKGHEKSAEKSQPSLLSHFNSTAIKSTREFSQERSFVEISTEFSPQKTKETLHEKHFFREKVQRNIHAVKKRVVPSLIRCFQFFFSHFLRRRKKYTSYIHWNERRL